MTASKRPLRVFLCHASGDKPAVRKLYEYLKKNGVDAWIDKEKVIPGQNWQIEIPKAVKNSDVVIVCLSSQSITKEGFVQKEIKFALDAADEKPEGTIFIIPARLEDCEVPERISKYQWVDLFSDDGFTWLIKALQIRASSIDATITPQVNAINFLSKKNNQIGKVGSNQVLHETKIKTESSVSIKPDAASVSSHSVKSVVGRLDRYWYFFGGIIAVEALVFGINFRDLMAFFNMFALIPLSTCLLAFFRPVYWGYSASFVIFLQGVVLLGGSLGGAIIGRKDWLVLVPIFIANAGVCALISFLRLRKKVDRL